ncbi:MAG: TetR/AcrR family transcriptional regulator [Bacteroidetes bacterium]|jgi:TetR/AcrR family fatty acid metabolism transcriptional regulator|nr:TetR/AcrR family transcriptional regulator [Bacteroidota bacterium]MBK6819235.1 TetR/AcrR family transcriptional regulator [Bacteroidota bacterium]MBK7041678.1 TetR/AcrR family transcriptional regulator [Bacteroidota bacterium]MBK7588337.1 TetR/AcrR family transcriptional regulator [Bacteroidota bacterium]MBK9301142.1 TetR/AcrR family transcriptional regulator [Bacteroidota bacterium]
MTKIISDRQLEIIEAAGKILTASGVSGLTIKNLAREMKFSESAIYRHFTSKEEIIVALLEYLARSMDIRYTNAVTNEQSPIEKFTTLFQNQFSFFKTNPHFVVAVFSDGLMEESKRINETILKIMGVKIKHLLPIILEGQQKNVFTNTITSDELMHIVMGTFRLQMYKWRVANFEFDIIRNGNNMIQSILSIICLKSS